ncbi:MAG: hypothetical protein A2172_02930 [Candidatus Woykebacteria bacterium RBG_13_40_15]|uniref:SAM-dependent methyltransferase n=1 Tax=Candidatus Woykebacteria bacterium RBG_13_40_15 TaxID=1802593 RepID=A0A1G1W5K6_9BACT|nr:MAG: hypothetical protein A2172_02930 [Candidatus Woykebacteria bacterium RBG_13_40_15]
MASNLASSSFRDPSGFVFKKNNVIYRQISKDYKENYDYLISSGLYKKLVDEGLLIPHKEVSENYSQKADAYKVIKPKEVSFISYPYEWCFSQLKDAALLTLKIQRISLDHGMSLKDASAFNIQFVEGKPVIIDTLSFEKYPEGKPWVAYKQFCQHFLAPLALMSYTDIGLNKLAQIYIDGVPLDLASKLLPFRSKLKLALLIHIHLHAASQKRYADKKLKSGSLNFSRNSFIGLVDSLESAIKNLKWKPSGTEWADYYPSNNNYVSVSLKQKGKLVSDFLKIAKPKNVWDIGGNTGLFSRIASDKGIQTISFDIDPAAVELNYQEVVRRNEPNILPLVIDLTNPSPAIGWVNNEREAFLDRGPTDMALALALVHHLAISNNVPLANLAEFFSVLCKSIIIEFVPKEDSQVKKLLSTREDIFPNYTQSDFEKEFTKFFKIKKSVPIKGSQRVLYLMTNGKKDK